MPWRYDQTDSDYLERLMAPLPVASDSLADVLEAYSKKGALPPEMPEEPLPCRDNKEFRELEAEVEQVLSTTHNGLLRLNLLTEIETRAQEFFCGACPIREQCEQWAKDDGDYEGIAGGRVSLSRSRPSLVEGDSETPRLCKCHGVPMTKNGKRASGTTSWRCAIRNAENRKKHVSTERVRAARTKRNQRYRQRKAQERLAA